jgi:hypothetical protein
MKKLARSYFYVMPLLCASSITFQLQAQTCLLSRMIEADGDTITFSYDGNNRLASLGKNSIVKTNASGNITEIIHDDAVNKSFSRSTFKYDNNNNLIEYEQFTGSAASPAFINKFKYNSFNQLIEAQSAVAVKQNYFYGYRVFEYHSTTTKNPATIKAYSGDAHGKIGEPDETIALTYDDKKISGYINPLDDFNPFTTHNVISAVVVEVGQKPKTETYAYQYNAAGYPTSKTEKENGHIYVTSYSYICK